MFTAWTKYWYIFQVKSSSWDHATPFTWDDNHEKLHLSSAKFYRRWKLWFVYYNIYAYLVFYQLVRSLRQKDVPIKKVLFDVGYCIVLTTIVFAMLLIIMKRREFVDAVNLMFQLDTVLQSKLPT